MKKWIESVNRPILALAPMHQVSRADLRKLCHKNGADVTFSEMVAAEAVIRHVPQAFEIMKHSKEEGIFIVQIFGNNPQTMAQAAKIIQEEIKPDGIDINLGCPVQKAAKQGFGSCQLQNADSVKEILNMVTSAVSLPVSIKMRAPSKNTEETIEFVRKIKEAGIYMVSVHGRTPTQKYGGLADWNHAYEIKKTFPDLIVLGNGDIKTVEDFKNKIGNLDGVMIGRWAKVHPEIFFQIKEWLPGKR